MIHAIIEIPLSSVQSEQYADNIKKNKHNENTCLICGKLIKDVSKVKRVHLLTNGNIVSYSGDDISESQGFFYVGNDCAKKLVINFAF